MNDFKDKIKSADRIVMAQRDILPLNLPVQQVNDTRENPYQKPTGLWYAIGTAWIDWVEDNMPKWKGNNIYKLDVNESSIIMLKTVDELNDFTVRFGMIPGLKHDYVTRAYANEYLSIEKIGRSAQIDWLMVSQLYAGIEISPYQWESRYILSWYYGWDVASGCIWNKKAVSRIERISL